MECLVAFATGVVAKIGESLVVPITKQFGYLVYFDKNINNLKSELKKLEGRKCGVHGRVDAERRNGRQIAPNVEDWLRKVNNIENELQGFYKDEVHKNNKCLGGWCLNLVSRHSSSKKAKKKMVDVVSLKEEKLEIISYPSPPSRLGSTFTNGIKSFASRTFVMVEVIDKLKDDEFKRIGICGMPGVGKTTFVKEVIGIIEENKLFDEVVMAVVSQNPDYGKIQGQIADALGLKFDKETVQGRACQLLDRLNHINSVLIVLDDVWTELDFESIGLPSNELHKGCKILFTSRNEDACHKMRSQKNFTISILSQDEACDFFMEMAGGDVVDKPDIHHIAKAVANECGGLPLAIVTIAKALANKERHMWEDALDQLRKSSVTSFSEMKDYVYSCIELSYNFLGNEETKSLLLLCSFFPEDFDIPIEVLLRHMVGLGLFKGIDALWKVRNRVHTLVDKLKRHFMLLESDEEECVKMHDVVRDVMISIASREEVSWRHSSAVSLPYDEIKMQTDDSECQNLQLLQVAVKKREAISENFFQGMQELMVLGLQNTSIQSMPSLFRALDNLHTLRLEDCQVGEISVIGKQLRKLEILSFARSDIKCLPIEIGQLSLLRLLDLTECNNLSQISSNALASLSRLEELYLRVRNFFAEENNSFLMGELQSLSHQLKVLEIAVMGVEALPDDMVFKNIVRFWVYVEDSSALFQGLVRRGYLHPNILKLNNIYYNNIKKSVTIQHLLKKAEILNLVDVKHLKNVVYELDKEGFPCLKNLSVGFCNNLEYVVDARCCTPSSAFPLVQSLSLHSLDNLKEICYVPYYESQMLHLAKGITSFQCFGNLRDLKVEFCTKLKSVFSLSSSASLATLRSLHVSECYGIECIILNKMEEDDKSTIQFSNLIELKLQELPSLIGFTKAIVMDKSHASKPQVQELSCSQLVEKTEVEDGQYLFGSDSGSAADISRATSGMLFKSNWMRQFPKLEKIWLCECSLLDMVFDLQESKFDNQSVAVFFGQLKEIELSWLTKLRHVWGNVPRYMQGFENLRTLKIKKCDSLKYLLTPTIAKAFTQLQKMVIQSCQLMEKVVGRELDENCEEEKEKVEILVFDKLDSLILKDLPGLVSVSSDSYELVWPSLRCLCIDGCPQLKTSPKPIQILTNQENLSVPSSSTIHDGGFCTSYEESSRFLQWCLGCTQFHAFSNSMAKAVSTYDHLPSVNEVNTKAETESSMPVLEQLQVKGCDSLDVIFQLEQNFHSSLTLNCLVKLMHISTSPVGVTGFNNLTLLSLDACHRLRYVFSYSIAKLLVKLQETKISNCKMLDQLVKREGEDRLIEFHESNSLNVLNTSQQSHATISKETSALEWPSLKRISIINCNMLEVVIVKEEERVDMASFAQVQSLMLSHLSNLVSFCHPPCTLLKPFLEESQAVCNEAWRKIRHGPLLDGFLFPNLRYLAIVGCNRICGLFSPSSSASLVCLQELEIRDCENIKEIVTKEETQPWVNKIVFHKLHHLKLERLSNLWAFCQGSYDFDFPSLQVVFFGNCHRMELFSYGSSYTPKLENVTMEIGQINKNIWMGDLNATARLSKGILTLQTSETLRWIEQDKGLLGYFTKETDMTVQGLQRLLSLVPSNAIHIFQHLKQLTVKSCSSLLEVFESEGGDIKKGSTMIHYELEVMNLYSLPKLRHIWNNLGGVLSFEKLRILKVEYCCSLKSTLSPSIARSLVELQHLRVYGCHMMEEIVTKEGKGTVKENKTKILFPVLNKLELRHLPNLKCFCPGTFNFEFPSCQEIIIEKCPKMTTFSKGTVSTPKLPHIYIGAYEYVDMMGDLNMTFYYHAHSEDFKMALQRSDTISWIEQDEHLLGYLTRITELVIEGCERLLNCVPSNMIQRFQHLKQLKIRECGSLVEIFESEGVDTNEGHASKVYDYNLQEMHLYSLTKLMHLWKNLDGVLGFQNLRKLNVGRCDGLKSVFSPSSARSLLQLQELSIYECETMEEIVTTEDERISEELNQAKIIFPVLQCLTLYHLPNLKCFCSTTYSFQLPHCRDITIKECSKMETCCYGTMSIPEFFL